LKLGIVPVAATPNLLKTDTMQGFANGPGEIFLDNP